MLHLWVVGSVSLVAWLWTFSFKCLVGVMGVWGRLSCLVVCGVGLANISTFWFCSWVVSLVRGG